MVPALSDNLSQISAIPLPLEIDYLTVQALRQGAQIP